MTGILVKLLGASWKTSLLGILSLVGIVADTAQKLLKGEPVDWTAVFTVATLAFAALKAKDSRISNAPNPGPAKPV